MNLELQLFCWRHFSKTEVAKHWFKNLNILDIVIVFVHEKDNLLIYRKLNTGSKLFSSIAKKLLWILRYRKNIAKRCKTTYWKLEMVFCYQNCSDLLYCEKKLNWWSRKTFEIRDREFAKFLRSLEQFIQTVKGRNNFW